MRLRRQSFSVFIGSRIFQRYNWQSLWNAASNHLPEVLNQFQPFLVGVLAFWDLNVFSKKYTDASLANIHIFPRCFCFNNNTLFANEQLFISHHSKGFSAFCLQGGNGVKLKRSSNQPCWKVRKTQKITAVKPSKLGSVWTRIEIKQSGRRFWLWKWSAIG